MHLCVNCRFSKPGSKVEYTTCEYIYPDKVEPVAGGELRQPYDFCSVLRKSSMDNVCGPDAKFFEAKA